MRLSPHHQLARRRYEPPCKVCTELFVAVLLPLDKRSKALATLMMSDGHRRAKLDHDVVRVVRLIDPPGTHRDDPCIRVALTDLFLGQPFVRGDCDGCTGRVGCLGCVVGQHRDSTLRLRKVFGQIRSASGELPTLRRCEAPTLPPHGGGRATATACTQASRSGCSGRRFWSTRESTRRSGRRAGFFDLYGPRCGARAARRYDRRARRV